MIVGCLRNASAVAGYVTKAGCPDITVVPAGERWPDGSLRPALEDWLGAGAVVSALRRTTAVQMSPEARAATAGDEAMVDVAGAVADSVSGLELRHRGHAADVQIAAAVDVTTTVPRLAAGAFRAED